MCFRIRKTGILTLLRNFIALRSHFVSMNLSVTCVIKWDLNEKICTAHAIPQSYIYNEKMGLELWFQNLVFCTSGYLIIFFNILFIAMQRSVLSFTRIQTSNVTSVSGVASRGKIKTHCFSLWPCDQTWFGSLLCSEILISSCIWA